MKTQNFTYVSTQTLQNVFPSTALSRPLSDSNPKSASSKPSKIKEKTKLNRTNN